MDNQNNEWWAGYQGDPFENMNYGLCESCKRRAIDRSEDPNSVLCRECREEIARQKKRRVVCIVGILVLVVGIVGGVAFFVYSMYSKRQNVQEAQEFLNSQGSDGAGEN